MMQVPHGIMFHHFYDHTHPVGQGAISKEELHALLEFVGVDRILSASEWFEKSTQHRLEPGDLCLTFDDSLKCQFDIAFPVLKDLGLSAFWFVYTAPLEGQLEYLEVFRHFRNVYFEDIDDFYENFFRHLNNIGLDKESHEKIAQFSPSTYLSGFGFYTDNDRKFRFIRDQVLGPQKYQEFMLQMMENANIDVQTIAKNLWMDFTNLQRLQNEQHVIGLHSHTHPTEMNKLGVSQQKEEYMHNQTVLESALGQPIQCMSHPCNSYNQHTIDILNTLGVQLGFRANMALAHQEHSDLEVPREDHINLIHQMHNENYSVYQ